MTPMNSISDNSINSVPHGIYNRIDTQELERQMQLVNWKNHPGNFFYSPEDRHNPEIRKMWYLQKQLDKLIDEKWKASDEEKYKAAEVWESLMVKYFSDTPLEKAITETVPYLTESFRNKKRLDNELNNNNLQNDKPMNTQNLEFLQSNLKYFGFGENLNEVLEKNIKEQKTEFQLNHEVQHFNNKMDYKLHFKKSDSTDMYFFNRYDAFLQNGKPELNRNQSFYINKGSGITAKEAYNLLEGRSVYKNLLNKEGEKYNAWLKLDFDNADERGNYKMKQFSDQYGYNLPKTLSVYPIKELEDAERKTALLNSLQKGNLQQVTMKLGDKEAKYFLEAVPQFKNVNIYDQKMHIVRREKLQVTNSQKESEAPAKKNQQNKGLDESQSEQKKTRKRKVSMS